MTTSPLLLPHLFSDVVVLVPSACWTQEARLQERSMPRRNVLTRSAAAHALRAVIHSVRGGTAPQQYFVWQKGCLHPLVQFVGACRN